MNTFKYDFVVWRQMISVDVVVVFSKGVLMLFLSRSVASLLLTRFGVWLQACVVVVECGRNRGRVFASKDVIEVPDSRQDVDMRLPSPVVRSQIPNSVVCSPRQARR